MRSLNVTLTNRHPTDISYFIDSAESYMDIGTDTATWLRFYCRDVAHRTERRRYLYDPAPAHGIDPVDVVPPHQDLGETAVRLERDYTDWLTSVKTPAEHKIVCTALAVQRIPDIIREAVGLVAERSVYENSKYYPLLAPMSKTIKSYPAKKNAYGKITMHDWLPVLEKDQHVAKSIKVVSNMVRRSRLLRAPFPDELHVRVRSNRPYLEDSYGRPAPERRFVREQRKVLRRGIKILIDLIGYDAARAFLTHREPLVIPGQRVTFKLTLNCIGPSSHGGASTEVHVGDNRVCNLCIYTPETPILDHVASIIRHVRLGLEDDILAIGNPIVVAATEPVGVDVLDKKLIPLMERHNRAHVIRRIRMPHIDGVVDADADIYRTPNEAGIYPDDLTRALIGPERIIRIGPSERTQKYRTRIAHRATRYIYKTYMSDYRRPAMKMIETHEGFEDFGHVLREPV